MTHRQYPIGKFDFSASLCPDQRFELIKSIEKLPHELRNLVDNVDDYLLNQQYRPQGWTVRQVIHHLPDSHLNGYLRFKWALTEKSPVIKEYSENLWAELPDSQSAPIQFSLDILSALHRRWAYLLKSLQVESFKKIYLHPGLGEITLLQALALYEWHGRHHLAHIRLVIDH